VRGRRANSDSVACPALRWRSVSHHAIGSSEQWSMRLVLAYLGGVERFACLVCAPDETGLTKPPAASLIDATGRGVA
jgi:hypothetical protein